MATKEKAALNSLRQKKKAHQQIVMLTAYDYPFARLLDGAGVDIILVGDSLGNVILGHENTLPVTMADMIHHTKAAAKGVKRARLVADLPNKAVTLANAKRLIKAGAQAVKIEGFAELKTIKQIIKAGIPVMGHLGFLPQKVKDLGGYKIQRDPAIVEQARVLEKAGVFALVLEMIPPELACRVTGAVAIPTIGCGAGPNCDGQVLVTYDILGLTDWSPSFAKKYLDVKALAQQAVKKFITEVRSGKFPERCP